MKLFRFVTAMLLAVSLAAAAQQYAPNGPRIHVAAVNQIPYADAFPDNSGKLQPYGNDQQQIQNAINDCPTQGCAVTIPSGMTGTNGDWAGTVTCANPLSILDLRGGTPSFGIQGPGASTCILGYEITPPGVVLPVHICASCTYTNVCAYLKTLPNNSVATVQDDTPGDHFTCNPLQPTSGNLYVNLWLTPGVPYTTDTNLIAGYDRVDCLGSHALISNSSQGCVVTPSPAFAAPMADPPLAPTLTAVSCSGGGGYTSAYVRYTYLNSVSASTLANMLETAASANTSLTGISSSTQCAQVTSPSAETGAGSYNSYFSSSGDDHQQFVGNTVLGTNLILTSTVIANPGKPYPQTNDSGALFILSQGNAATGGAPNGTYNGDGVYVRNIFGDCANYNGTSWTAYATVGFYIANAQENSGFDNVGFRDCGGIAGVIAEGRNGAGSTGAVNAQVTNVTMADAKATNCGGTSGLNGALGCNPGSFYTGTIPSTPFQTGYAPTGAACVLIDQTAMRKFDGLTCTPNGAAGGTQYTVDGVEQIGPDVFGSPSPGRSTPVYNLHCEGKAGVFKYCADSIGAQTLWSNIQGDNGGSSAQAHEIHFDINSVHSVAQTVIPLPSGCAILDDINKNGCGNPWDTYLGQPPPITNSPIISLYSTDTPTFLGAPAPLTLDNTQLSFIDEFLTKGNGTSSIGNLTWTETAIVGGTCGTATTVTPPVPLVGVIQFTTPAVTGEGCEIGLTNSSGFGTVAFSGLPWQADFVFQFPSTTTGQDYRIGFASGAFATVIPSAGVYMRFAPSGSSDTSMQLCVTVGGTENCYSAGAPFAPGTALYTRLHIVDMVSSGNTSQIGMSLYYGGSLLAPLATFCASGCSVTVAPPVSAISPMFSLVSRNAAADPLNVDRFDYQGWQLPR